MKARIETLKKQYPLLDVESYNSNEVHMVARFAQLTPSTMEDIKTILKAEHICVSYCPGKHIQGIVIIADYYKVDPIRIIQDSVDAFDRYGTDVMCDI